MAGFTNDAFRRILSHWGGVGLLATEMVHARGILEMQKRHAGLHTRLHGLDPHSDDRISDNTSLKKVSYHPPTSVQIWDNQPETLEQLAYLLTTEYGAQVIDINFGCPAPRVAGRGRSGAFLLSEPLRIGNIVHRVVMACKDTPVTAKIRLGINAHTITAMEVAQAIEEAGASAITVHGRTASQMYTGNADWEKIAELRSVLKRIPLIGNGDIRSPEDALRAFIDYGVDGVMIGRAALKRPWIFRCTAAFMVREGVLEWKDAFPGYLDQPEPISIESFLNEPSVILQRDILLDHYQNILDQFGEVDGTRMMRRYAACYGTGMRGARKFRAAISTVTSAHEFRHVVRTLFPCE